MNNTHRANSNSLDVIRIRRGNLPLREYFKSLNPQTARKTINDPALSFPSFFLLLPVIQDRMPLESLSTRGQTAVNLCDVILSSKKVNGNVAHPSYDEATHEALRWIFLTGTDDDGISEDFDHILDISAGVLTKKYHDADILPKLVRVIFSRNRKGGYLHDIAWAFYQSHDPKALRMAAEYLRSSNEQDAKLARTLLHLGQEPTAPQNKRAMYENYLHWLDENDPYLYFTSENFNETSAPNVCSVDLGAKYLYRRISPKDRKPATPLTETERNCLTCFQDAPKEEKELLARFSQKMRTKDPSYWNRWIRYPLKKQIETAHNGGEGNV